MPSIDGTTALRYLLTAASASVTVAVVLGAGAPSGGGAPGAVIGQLLSTMQHQLYELRGVEVGVGHVVLAAALAVLLRLAAAAALKPAVYVRDFAVFKPDPRWVGCFGSKHVTCSGGMLDST
jgi:hypothetical protein